MGSEEPHATPSVHEEILATSAEENVNEELMTQAADAEEPDVPLHEEPEIVIPEVVLQLTDTPQPKPKDPFSKKQKFKADDFFGEHVFFTEFNPYDNARLRRKRFWTASKANLYSSVLFNKDKLLDHEHIPHMDMESMPCFTQVLNLIHDAGLLNFCTDIVE